MTDAHHRLVALNTRLRATAGVHGVHLVERHANGRATVVAYVAGGERAALEAVLADHRGAALVRIDALPLDAVGAVDEQALETLPAWPAQAAAPDAAGVPVHRPTVRRHDHLHLADLLPGRPLLSPHALPDPQPAARSADRATNDARPSLHRTEPAAPDARVSPDLGAALRRAAAMPGAGFVHVAADMSETRIGYDALHRHALQVLGGLREQGVQPGEVVIVDASDVRSLLPVFWACVLGGIVAAPFALSAAASGGAHVKRLRDSWEVLGRPRVIADPAVMRMLADTVGAELRDMPMLDAHTLPASRPADPEAVPPVDPASVALVLLTSGSTGMPKGVMLTRANIAAMITGVRDYLQLRAGDTSLNWMPLDHVGALVYLSVQPLVLGMNQVHVDTATILAAPNRWLDLVHAHRVVFVWAPNFAFDLLLQAAAQPGAADWDLACLRALVNGGEAVSGHLLGAFVARFARNGLSESAIWPSFGMTETASGFTFKRWGSGGTAAANLGRPIRGCAQRIVDDAGRVLDEGRVGHIEFSGPSVFAGYYGRPDLTAAAMHGEWFRCGDMGFMRDGDLFVVGRSKEMIIVNGVNFYNAEIEEAIAQVDGVERAGVAAIGVRAPDAHTDRLAVFFHAPGAVGDDALKQAMLAIRTRLVKDIALAPDYFIAVAPEQLPRTSSGKIQRVDLKRQVEAGRFDADIKRAARLIGGVDTIPSWFAEPIWRPCVGQPDSRAAQASIAVLGANAATLQALRAAWPHARWMPSDATDGPTFAAFLRACGAQGTMPDTVLATGDRAEVRSALSITQVFATLDGAKPSTLVLCGGPAESAEARAMSMAFLRAAALELPFLQCVYIDLGEEDASLHARDVCTELQLERTEAEVLYRDGRRHARRFRTTPLPAPSPAPGIRPGGIHLLSGGLGGIGVLLARHLLSVHQARVLIVGRTPEAALPVDRAQALASLAQSGDVRGNVQYACADVADPAALRAAIDGALAHWGGKLDGVWQLAGEGTPAPLQSETPETFERKLRAKVAGTRALHRLVEADPDAAFVVFGSVAGMVGGNQVAAYAAANAWQQAFVRRLADSGHRHCRYLGFSSWRDTGMSRGTTSPALLESAGYFPIDPAHGLQSIEAALHAECPVLAVGLDLRHPRHARHQEGGARAADELVLVRAGEPAAPTHASLDDALGRPGTVPVVRVDALPLDGSGAVERAQLLRLATGAQQRVAARTAFERFIAQIWGDVLSLNAVECGVHDDFFALGGDSLRAARACARIREVFGLDASMADLLAYPTLAQFCERVSAFERTPGITEAAARRLFEIAKMTPEQKASLRAKQSTQGKSS
ncbi:hypothetical protein C5O80_05660 [Burkholderia sp. SRS-46]|nr:hypothetical protein C5O80_05660 [Burkholderia sp. SRS-46]